MSDKKSGWVLIFNIYIYFNQVLFYFYYDEFLYTVLIAKCLKFKILNVWKKDMSHLHFENHISYEYNNIDIS